MQYLKLTFEEISQKNILYYDKSVEEACFDICNSLKIDNLPDYDSIHYYELEDRRFCKKKITEDVQLKEENRIFDWDLLEKFDNNKHNVLFVYKGEVLNGIVHFSDYNQTKVLQAIQEDVLTFERRMREYFFLMNYRNDDLIQYFHYRAKKKKSKNEDFYLSRIRDLEKRASEMNQLGEFQLFDLKDLLEFGNSKKSRKLFPSTSIILNGEKKSQIKLITYLRNMAMHGKNPVEKHKGSSVYSIESLRQLFQALKTLEELTYRVEKLIHEHKDYQKSVELDNQKKLEIIHQHHPQALNYFIGNH